MSGLKQKLRKQLKRVRGTGYRLLHPNKQRFNCPICHYDGPFLDANDPTGLRKHAMCPNCSSLERHRVFWLALESLPERKNFRRMSLLHFAPEPELEGLLRRRFGKYETADLYAPGVDHRVDLRDLPFADGSYDMVIASHVLEHIKEDSLALQNIRRVLKPGGLAILQVPVVGKTTVEYPKPNPQEWDHVRAPGEDYFDRYATVFSKVKKLRSSQFDSRCQPYIFEDRSHWPPAYSLRQTTPGERHEDIVPICYV